MNVRVRKISPRLAWQFARYMGIVWGMTEQGRVPIESEGPVRGRTPKERRASKWRRRTQGFFFASVTPYMGGRTGERRVVDDPHPAFFSWAEVDKVLDALSLEFGTDDAPSYEHRNFAYRHWVEREKWNDYARGVVLLNDILKRLVVVAEAAEHVPEAVEIRMLLNEDRRERQANADARCSEREQEAVAA